MQELTHGKDSEEESTGTGSTNAIQRGAKARMGCAANTEEGEKTGKTKAEIGVNMNGIPIGNADSLEEVFYSPGVAIALESIFKRVPFDFDADSREYAEVARAYWTLHEESPELFPARIPSVNGEMAADVAPKGAGDFSWCDEAVNVLFRRVLLGLHRSYADFQQMVAISAFNKTRISSSASSGHNSPPSLATHQSADRSGASR